MLAQEMTGAAPSGNSFAYDIPMGEEVDVARLVFDARCAAGLTQQELAERMGTHQTYISAIERGSRVPTVSTLSKIAIATDRHLILALG